MSNNEFDTMPTAQKIAILLITLGEKSAAQIFTYLDEEEIRKISYWINETNEVSQPVMEKCLNEFLKHYEARNELERLGGHEFLSRLVDYSKNKQKIKNIVSNLQTDHDQLFSEILNDADPSQLSAYFTSYSAETISLIFYHLPPARSAEILLHLPASKQLKIFEYLIIFDTLPKATQNQLLKSTSDLLGKNFFQSVPQQKSSESIAHEIIDYLPEANQKELVNELRNRSLII